MHAESYESVEQLNDLLDKSDEPVTTLANTSAFLYALLNDVNWVGFYLLRGEELYLGPFQGKPACTRIQVGKGVCGTAVAEAKTQRVDDVHSFPGHIACDSVHSELVVLLYAKDGAVMACWTLTPNVLTLFAEDVARRSVRRSDFRRVRLEPTVEIKNIIEPDYYKDMNGT